MVRAAASAQPTHAIDCDMDDDCSCAAGRSGKLLELLGAAGGSEIAAMFRRMEIAEREIAAAKQRWPRKRKTLHAAFGILCAPRLRDYSDDVYRAHARELLGRVMRGEPVEPATDAELLGMFSETSLVAPLSSSFARAMSVVFRSVFPSAPALLAAGREAWEGETDEILRDARKRLAVDRSCT